MKKLIPFLLVLNCGQEPVEISPVENIDMGSTQFDIAEKRLLPISNNSFWDRDLKSTCSMDANDICQPIVELTKIDYPGYGMIVVADMNTSELYTKEYSGRESNTFYKWDSVMESEVFQGHYRALIGLTKVPYTLLAKKGE